MQLFNPDIYTKIRDTGTAELEKILLKLELNKQFGSIGSLRTTHIDSLLGVKTVEGVNEK